MEIKQLETFVCVAKNLNFSKAAEVMYVSQPTVSANISALEKALGVQLLIRSTKEVSLTKAGVGFLPYAQQILSLREQAICGARGENPDAPGEIGIISSTIPAQYLLPELIASFQKERPNVVFHVEQADSGQVAKEMSGFRYDFGMVGTIPESGRFIRFPVYGDELVFILPNGSPLSDAAIREDFANHVLRTPFIMREAGSGTRAEIEAIFTKIGVDFRELNIPAYFSDSHSILLAVSRGMGVSLISKAAAALYAEAGMLRAVEMNSPLFRRIIYMLYNKELWLSPLQTAFSEHVKGFYQKAKLTL